METVTIFENGSFEIDGVIHWVTRDGDLMEDQGQDADGNLFGKPALKNPRAKNAKDIILKPGDRIDRTGRIQRKNQGIRYPEEVRERAKVLMIAYNFDWDKVLKTLGEEFTLERLPHKQTLYAWSWEYRKWLLEKGLLPKALKAQAENLDQDKDIKTRQRAAEYVQDRADGKPVQPVTQTIGTYDLTHVLDMGTDEKPEEEKKKTPDHEWI